MGSGPVTVAQRLCLGFAVIGAGDIAEDGHRLWHVAVGERVLQGEQGVGNGLVMGEARQIDLLCVCLAGLVPGRDDAGDNQGASRLQTAIGAIERNCFLADGQFDRSLRQG